MTTDQQLTPNDGIEEAVKPEHGSEASETSATTEAAIPDNTEADAGNESTSEAPAVESTPEPETAPEPEPEPVVAAAPAPAPAPAAPAPAVSDADLFEAAMRDLESDVVEGSGKKLTKGERIEATVIQVETNRVFVDLGSKSEGIITLEELTDENIDDANTLVKIGDKINVIVLKTAAADQNPLLSKKRADFENAWLGIESQFTAGQTINAPVVERVKGGLVVDIGVRGFVPATHVGNGKLRNIDKYVGQTIPLKILEIDRERKKVVLSNRLAEEEAKSAAKESLFGSIKVGDIVEGAVRRLTDYGAFVDLGGVDGLLHISEMSWMRINHPKEMFKEGQSIQVMVLKLDANNGKISLGHRQVLPDPWNLIKEKYVQGQKLTVTIGRIVQSGAFVKLPEGAEAFIPLSEMSVKRIKKAQEVIEEGAETEVQIIDLRPGERRMVLSMRALQPGGNVPHDRGGYGGGSYGVGSDFEDRDFRKLGGKNAGKKGKKSGSKGGRRDEDDIEEYMGRRGFASSGTTIGERLGLLKGIKLREDEDDAEEATEEKTEEKTEE